METLGQVLALLLEQMFVGREAVLAAFADWLIALDDPPTILEVNGPGGIGKTALLGAFVRLARRQGYPVLRLDGGAVRPTPGELARALAEAPIAPAPEVGHPRSTRPDDVVAYLNTARPLILVDDVEALAADGRGPWPELLSRLGGGVKVAVAARSSLAASAGDAGDWARLIRPLALTSFSQAEAEEYLARRGIADRERVERILDAAGGHPLALSLAADLAQTSGRRDFADSPEWNAALQRVAERLLRDLDGPEQWELVEAAAVVRQFDQTSLAALAGRPVDALTFGRLGRLSLVRATPHGLALHDDPRRILADNLRWRDPTRFDALRLRALAHYRERVRTAGPAELAWLVAERLALWENAVVRALLFGEERPGRVTVEPGRPADVPTILERYPELLRAVIEANDGPSELFAEGANLGWIEPLRAFVRAALEHPAARVRVVRDRDGAIVGFSTIMPVCGATLELLERHPPIRMTLEAYFSPEERASLPADPRETPFHYLIQIAHGPTLVRETRAALTRDLVGLFARGGVYLMATPLRQYIQFAETLGWRPLPAARGQFWGASHPTEAFVLDLRAGGAEAWIEALLGGRRPPRHLSPDELERELRLALERWHDDAFLAGSPLAALPSGEPGGGMAGPAERLRRSVRRALDRARAGSRPDQVLAYEALELAYLRRAGSFAQMAATLAVSERTFYRLLERGIRALARALRPV